MNLTLLLMDKKGAQKHMTPLSRVFWVCGGDNREAQTFGEGAEIRRFAYLLANFVYPPNFVCYYNDYWEGS